jgi:hypothetical protein
LRWNEESPHMADEPIDPQSDDEEAATAEPDDVEAEDETPQAPVVPDGDAIQALDEDELRSLHAAMEEWRVGARERRDVDGVRAALDAQGRIVAEISRRREEEARVDEQLADLDQQIADGGPSLPPIAEPVGSGANAAQLAAAVSPQTPAEQTPAPPPRSQVALLAAAGNGIVATGESMSLEDLGIALERAKNGPEGTTILASFPAYSESDPAIPTPLSMRLGAEVNDEMIREAVADWSARRKAEAMQAAVEYVARQGAICQPYDIIRDIPDAFVTTTPVADMFPTRPAGRGGFQFTRSGLLTDVLAGVTIWNEANQAAVDPTNSATWKPCVEFACPTTATAVLEWITTCATYPITLEMSNAERVANLNNALAAVEARVYEGRILQRIDQLSYGYVFSGDYGALPATIEAINTVLSQLTYANRQSAGNYDLILPPSFIETLIVDNFNRGFNADLTVDVLDILRANVRGGIRIVESLDSSLGGEPGLPFVPLPPVGNQNTAGSPDYLTGQVLRMRLVDPSAAIFAQTGEMNAGALRDANLVRQNRTGYFREEGFFLEKHGPQPWATIDIKLCADGARAGLAGPHGCTTS